MLGNYINDEVLMLNQLGDTTGFVHMENFFIITNFNNNLFNITTTFVTLNENESAEPIIYQDNLVQKTKDIIFTKATAKTNIKNSDENIIKTEELKIRKS